MDLVDGFRKCFALSVKNFMGNILRCIIIIESHTLLDDDRAIVINFVGKMDGATAYFYPFRMCSPMNTHAVKSISAEGRDQCRMDVNNIPF